MPENISTKPPPVNPQDLLRLKHAFVALCAARAHRFGQGELSLHDAVDYLQEWAVTRGLVEASGQDTIQNVIAKAFRGVNP